MRLRNHFIIDTEAARTRAATIVGGLGFDPPKIVSIKKYVKNRSLSQNRLLMLWIGEINKHWLNSTGEVFTADTWKEQLKQQFLGIECFSLPDGSIAHRTKRTRDLTTTEFTAFLEQIEYWAISELECQLPHPEDIYFESMGAIRR